MDKLIPDSKVKYFALSKREIMLCEHCEISRLARREMKFAHVSSANISPQSDFTYRMGKFRYGRTRKLRFRTRPFRLSSFCFLRHYKSGAKIFTRLLTILSNTLSFASASSISWDLSSALKKLSLIFIISGCIKSQRPSSK